MDFIKTSSLRALIELTFQRNWNGLIWMSRKGVTTKRVKTVQTALSRTAPKPRSPAGRGTNPAVGHATTAHANAAHDHAARAGKQSLAAAQPVSRTTADGTVRAGKLRPASGRDFIGQSSSVRPQRPTTIRPATTVPIVLAAMTRLSGRSSRPTVQRRGRPEARFEARFIFSSPA
ncbi:unnamed protein product [Microthlaspi erraticum]|uniref:Uncharacterized protein n=1 Tax=Microthlaspi erraticum TaxID=1685480 RepID=A0A6D2JQP2_9BRAS|nr:unnamed protein product [Microthlaspi erraticum]